MKVPVYPVYLKTDWYLSATYYHYTDKDSANEIISSGRIMQSTDTRNDAVFGQGTYMTRIPPDTSKSAIAMNNYDGQRGYHFQKVNAGKTDVAIELKLPIAKVQNCSGDGRDIHRYPGNVDFRSPDVKSVDVHVIGDNGRIQTYSQK